MLDESGTVKAKKRKKSALEQVFDKVRETVIEEGLGKWFTQSKASVTPERATLTLHTRAGEVHIHVTRTSAEELNRIAKKKEEKIAELQRKLEAEEARRENEARLAKAREKTEALKQMQKEMMEELRSEMGLDKDDPKHNTVSGYPKRRKRKRKRRHSRKNKGYRNQNQHNLTKRGEDK